MKKRNFGIGVKVNSCDWISDQFYDSFDFISLAGTSPFLVLLFHLRNSMRPLMQKGSPVLSPSFGLFISFFFLFFF